MNNRRIKLAALFVIALLGFAYPFLTSTAGTESQRRSQTKPGPQARTRAQTPPARYSKFSHSVAQHQLACDSCHKFPTSNWKEVRKTDAAFPDVTEYPEHSSCVSCHRQQFFRGAQPAICSVCHANVTPGGGPRHPFPNPTEIFDASSIGRAAVSEFAISFPHDKHVDIVEGGGEESEPKSCAACHKTYQPQGDSDEEFVTKPPKNLAEDQFWLKKGAFKTSPASHATCFACHTEDSGLQPAPRDCGTCHKLLPANRQIQLTAAHNDFDPKLAAAMGVSDKAALEKWSNRDTAKFRHEWLPHAGLSCMSCHNYAAINTLDEMTKKVAVRSCGGEGTGCHIEANTEGILNLELEKKRANPSFECTKCHVNNGRKPAPETHVKAITSSKKSY